jgi:hypothetical protein
VKRFPSEAGLISAKASSGPETTHDSFPAFRIAADRRGKESDPDLVQASSHLVWLGHAYRRTINEQTRERFGALAKDAFRAKAYVDDVLAGREHCEQGVKVR